ncbi:MAG: NAD(P)-dependent alcohol dehydrogenase [Actinobacteria bacterium]|nr:MAG: NAD(P)-dependent alcohol dehydrogenase [Actinomycetota bacterium]
MRAVVQDKYGEPADVLSVRDVPRPVAGPGEVLVRVHASSVHADVWHAVSGQPYVLRLMGSGVRAPKIGVPGTDLAGVVELVGSGVRGPDIGDRVFGEVTPTNQWRNGGALAQYAAVPADRLARIPDVLSFEAAAAVPTPALIALMNLRDEGRVRAGQRVLVNGAGGGVGVYAVQMAKAFGAEVTAVDAGPKLPMLTELGADHVIDYTQYDFTQMGQRYDIVLDVVSQLPFARIRQALEPDGTFVLIGHDQYGQSGHRWLGSMGRMLPLLATAPFRRQIPGIRSGPSRQANMATLVEMLTDGRLRPVVDRTFALEDVPAAISYLASGHAVGRVVISI